MENVIFANGFEEYVDGVKQCPSKNFPSGEIKSEFVQWRRLVLALAFNFQWPIKQLDIENAFLNWDLQEEVYMSQPPGFVDSNFPHYVCKLNKALYGLKQASRAWFHKLRIALLQYGFNSSRADSSLFFYHTKKDTIILLVYVNDILVTGSDPSLVSHFITSLY